MGLSFNGCDKINYFICMTFDFLRSVIHKIENWVQANPSIATMYSATERTPQLLQYTLPHNAILSATKRSACTTVNDKLWTSLSPTPTHTHELTPNENSKQWQTVLQGLLRYLAYLCILNILR